MGGREYVFWQTADTAAGQGIGGATSFRRRWRRNRRNMACSEGLNCQTERRVLAKTIMLQSVYRDQIRFCLVVAAVIVGISRKT